LSTEGNCLLLLIRRLSSLRRVNIEFSCLLGDSLFTANRPDTFGSSSRSTLFDGCSWYWDDMNFDGDPSVRVLKSLRLFSTAVSLFSCKFAFIWMVTLPWPGKCPAIICRFSASVVFVDWFSLGFILGSMRSINYGVSALLSLGYKVNCLCSTWLWIFIGIRPGIGFSKLIT